MQRFTARMPLLMATNTFGLGRTRWSSPQQCYLHCLHTNTDIKFTKKWFTKVKKLRQEEHQTQALN